MIFIDLIHPKAGRKVELCGFLSKAEGYLSNMGHHPNPPKKNKPEIGTKIRYWKYLRNVRDI